MLPLYSFSGSVTLRVIYGKTTPVSLTQDPYLLHLKRMVPIVQGALLPGAYRVDRFPILRHVPWYGRQLKKWGEEEYQMLMWNVSQFKSQMVSRGCKTLDVGLTHECVGDGERATVGGQRDHHADGDGRELERTGDGVLFGIARRCFI